MATAAEPDGALMVLLGFAWFLFTLSASDSRLVYTFALVVGGLWGGVFLHLGLSFPTGRLTTPLDRALVVAGYVIFPLASVPALFFSGPHELGCDDCPTNLLLARCDEDLANVANAFAALLYAQSRLVALAVLLRAARRKVTDDGELAGMLERAIDELQTSLSELRELAHGIHPAVLTDRGLEPALQSLASRAPVPVRIEAARDERLPGAVESAAYFVVSEALTNVAKYARATQATVAVRRVDGVVTVDVTDDGVGGADATGGSGLHGLADRVASLDGTLRIESPAGCGTRVHAEIPLRAD